MTRKKRTFAAAISAACLAALMAPSAAWAAPGDPFSPDQPTLFVAQVVPGETGTTLFEAVAGADGTYTFEEHSPEADISYNAVSWHPADGYMYGIVQTANDDFPQYSVVRIDAEGTPQLVGDSIGEPPFTRNWNVGAFGEPNMLYVSGGFASTNITVVDVTTGEVVRTIDLTDPFGSADFEFIDGNLWAISSTLASRIDTVTGQVDRFELPFELPGGAYGAAWQFGNGNLGVENNGGTVFQIAITDGDSAAPTFELVSESEGPAATLNDGTAIPGGPVDLSIDKSVAPGFTPGEDVEWTITVRNEGPFIASGWVIRDLLPAGTSFVSADSPSCTSIDGVVSCVGGRLQVGEAVDISVITSTASDSAECISNDALVLGNDRDDVVANNTATATTCQGEIEVEKTVSAGDGVDVAPGDAVTYTLTFTNSGPGGATVDHVDVLGDVTDDGEILGEIAAASPLTVSMSGESLEIHGPLAAGQSAEVIYDVRVADTSEGGELVNVVASAGDTPSTTCEVGDPMCTQNPIVAESPVVVPPAVEPPAEVPSVEEPPAESGPESLATTGQSMGATVPFLLVGAGMAALGVALWLVRRRQRIQE
ncbi:MAG: DUF6923 family protein [Actinomycetota bacterium]